MRNPPPCLTVGAFTIAAALATAAFNVSVAPVTNAMYRTLAFGDADGRSANGRRLNARGEPGDRFQIDHRWTLPSSVLVLAALAITVSRVRTSVSDGGEGGIRTSAG